MIKPNFIRQNNFEVDWESIIKRNLFFIKLRYLAAFSIALFSFSPQIVNAIHLTALQFRVLFSVSVFLLLYNAIIHYFVVRAAKQYKARTKPPYFSLIQMIVDLILLTVAVFITGGIESPFLSFYIFHMIIGSLILPAYIVYATAFVVSAIITIITFTEFYGIIPHYCLFELSEFELYYKLPFVILTLTTFYITLFFSVFIANKIARQLYLQEARLRDALNELKKSNERKHKYILGVMHEIKSPISASQSIVSLITDGYAGEVSETIKEKLQRIAKRNSDAIEMINEILKISRMSLLDEKELETIEPYELLKAETDKIKETAFEKNIEVTIAEPEGNPREIVSSQKALELAISNILSNAVKYTPNGGKIEASLFYKNDFVEIKICDSGKGIPKEETEKIFIPFYRLKRDKGKHEGSGLGLAFVKEIIDQQNGEILIESPSHLGTEENPGTCFIVRIPYSPDKKIVFENEI